MGNPWGPGRARVRHSAAPALRAATPCDTFPLVGRSLGHNSRSAHQRPIIARSWAVAASAARARPGGLARLRSGRAAEDLVPEGVETAELSCAIAARSAARSRSGCDESAARRAAPCSRRRLAASWHRRGGSRGSGPDPSPDGGGSGFAQDCALPVTGARVVRSRLVCGHGRRRPDAPASSWDPGRRAIRGRVPIRRSAGPRIRLSRARGRDRPTRRSSSRR